MSGDAKVEYIYSSGYEISSSRTTRPSGSDAYIEYMSFLCSLNLEETSVEKQHDAEPHISLTTGANLWMCDGESILTGKIGAESEFGCSDAQADRYADLSGFTRL